MFPDLISLAIVVLDKPYGPHITVFDHDLFNIVSLLLESKGTEMRK